jgi:hypothetical protein
MRTHTNIGSRTLQVLRGRMCPAGLPRFGYFLCGVRHSPAELPEKWALGFVTLASSGSAAP